MIHLEPQPPEEVVAPLDAYVTCKPDEPPFTLQGGDPLAAPLVRLWATAARGRCGIGSMHEMEGRLEEVWEATREHSVADDERERDNLLVRATAAEEVSWAMDEYRKHGHATEKPSEAQDTHLPELQRIELHDLKVRVAQKLSNFRCELKDIGDALEAAGYDMSAEMSAGGSTINQMFLATDIRLKLLNEEIEPRRIFKS